MGQRQEKILVRGVNWLGDAVMTTPALQRLREARPEAWIELLTHEKIADLWRGHPSIDAAIPFSPGQGLRNVARALRGRQFDVALLFPNSLRSALEVVLARIPRRIGYARNLRGFLLTDAVAPRSGSARMHKRSEREVQRRIASHCSRETYPPSAHHVHDYLRLVAELGGCADPVPPLLSVSEHEVQAVRNRFGLGGRILALHAGAEYGPAKRWPSERFFEVAVKVHSAVPSQYALLGGSRDREAAERMAEALSARLGPGQVVNLAGETSLRELCAVLKASAVLLSNDSGPMHVATALGTPVVVPFGSTSPELTGPWPRPGSSHHVALGAAACAPCFRRECPVDFRCMQSISVEEMAAAVLKTLARPGVGSL